MVPLFAMFFLTSSVAGLAPAKARKTRFACVLVLLLCAFASHSHAARRGEREIEASHNKVPATESSPRSLAVATGLEVEQQEKKMFLKFMIQRCTIPEYTRDWTKGFWFITWRREAAPFVEVKVGKIKGNDVSTFNGSVAKRTSSAGDGLRPAFNEVLDFEIDNSYNSFQLIFWFDELRILEHSDVIVFKDDAAKEMATDVHLILKDGSTISYQFCRYENAEEAGACFHDEKDTFGKPSRK